MISAPRNQVEIDLKALQENCRTIQKRIGPQTRILAVVKSDGYGHGMIPAAQALSETGVKAFGVAEVHEAVSLREAGVQGDIVIFLGARETEYDEVVHFGLQPIIFDVRQLESLAAFADRKEVTVGVHLKVDTGMGRLGFMPAELEQYAAIIRREKSLFFAGLMSHFPCADSAEFMGTREQNKLFGKLSAQMSGSDHTVPLHIANSAAVMRSPDLHWDMVRPGISLYGCCPSEECLGLVDLKPVMSFRTEIIQVKEVPAGCGISYGHTFFTSRPSKLALLPVGYNDGFLRSLSNKSHVLVHGKRAEQRGRVCMNVTVVDVTDIPGVQPGDEVVLMGSQGGQEITADEIAGWMDTINYEVLCLFGNLNSRVYL